MVRTAAAIESQANFESDTCFIISHNKVSRRQNGTWLEGANRTGPPGIPFLFYNARRHAHAHDVLSHGALMGLFVEGLPNLIAR